MSRRRTEQSTTDSSNSAAAAAAAAAAATERLRRRRRNSAPILRRAFCESLEDRCLFNTVITDTDPLTAAPNSFTFEYKDFENDAVRVTVSGNVQAEFIFARVTKGGSDSTTGWNQVILGDAVAPTSKEDGRDLFHVYIASATIDSYIAIARVPGPDTQGPRPMQPFTGNVSLTITPLRTDNLVRTTAGGTGEITLGTRTRTVPNVDNSGNRPITSDNFNGQGIAPADIAGSNGQLTAGLSTAPGVNLGRFLFGGTIMGRVSIQGAMETFYCGQLLTGITQGQGTEFSVESPGNFYVQGDIRNILVKGSIGGTGVASTRLGRAAPDYLSGTDFDIRGRVGQIRTGEDYQAWGTIANSGTDAGMRARQQEVEEDRIDPGANRGSVTNFQNGQLGDNEAFFNNDDFANAQLMGSINSRTLGDGVVHIEGQLESGVLVQDLNDYYAVGLMAGQRVNVRLLAPEVFFVNIGGVLVPIVVQGKSPINLGVFDPDNRLVYSDYSKNTNLTDPEDQAFGFGAQQQEWFTFVADKPGIWRFAVAQTTDPTFTGTAAVRSGPWTYQLMIQGVGQMGLGGLVANQTISFTGSPFFGFGQDEIVANIEVINGDIGAVYSITDNIVSSEFIGGFNAVAYLGDLRAFDALSLGSLEGTTTFNEDGTFEYVRQDGAQLTALTGSVGMIRGSRASTTDTVTMINEGFNFFFGEAGEFNIGGDVQYIVAPNMLVTDLAVNGKIGVVQAAQFGAADYAGSLSANADGVGTVGTIDLIHCTQGLGARGVGGPIISAGSGGNMRYIFVNDTGATNVFRPTIYGGGSPEETNFVPGQSFTYTDDSGANVQITPTSDQFIDPITGGVQNLSGTLSILTYPVAPSVQNPFASGGGLALVRATSTRGMRISSDGLTEIGDIESLGPGPGLVVNPFNLNGPDGSPNSGDEDWIENATATGINAENSITLRPTGKRGLIDVWNIRGNNFNFIKNHTGGEIVNGQIGQTGSVLAKNIGWARSNVEPGMTIEGSNIADLAGTSETEGTTFPFNNAHNAFTINGGGEGLGAILELEASESIGNVMINGIAMRIAANADGVGTRGVFEGITGAIFTQGQLRQIDVGEGLLPSGTGNLGRAGIYSIAETPGQLNGVNLHTGRIWLVTAKNADIRGDIITNSGINRVEVLDGSIIGAEISVGGSPLPADQGSGLDLAFSREFGGGVLIRSGFGEATGNVQNVTVNASGTVAPGGIIGASFLAFNIGSVTVNGGFGVINTDFQTTGTGRVGNITADGYGVRGVDFGGGQSVEGINARGSGQKVATTFYSPSVRFSEFAAFDPFFGTKPGPTTDLHVMLGTTAAAPIRRGNANATGSIDFVTVGVSRDIGPVKANTVKVSEFNVPNLFTSLEVADYIDTITVTTGRIPLLVVANDSLRSRFEVAGDAETVSFGNFRGTSSFTSRGKIGVFKTRRSLYGNVYAQNGIQAVRVGGSYGSQGSRTPQYLQEFKVDGDVLAGSVFTIEKNLGKLDVGGSVQPGASIKVGSLGTKEIDGTEAPGAIDIKPWA